MKQETPGRAITVTLVLKVLALIVLWVLFFSPSHRPPSDSGHTAAHVFGASEASQGQSRENDHGT